MGFFARFKKISVNIHQEVGMKKTIPFGDYEVVIQLPNLNKDLSYSKDNNIVCFKAGNIVWEIEELLDRYSKENHLKYFDELYFDIAKDNNGKLRCTGFTNHCIIDVDQQQIISLINNW